MDDASFNELRDALAPERDLTSRQGALYLLEMSLDDDPRIVSLLSTLLMDGELDLVATAAALIYRKPELRSQLERELERAWRSKALSYRRALLHKLGDGALHELAPIFAEVEDTSLRLELIGRLERIPESQSVLDALLFLSHDKDANVRAACSEVLAKIGGTAAIAALDRLSHDTDPAVRKATAPAIQVAFDEDQASETLKRLAADDDAEVRDIASNCLESLRKHQRQKSVENLVQEMAKAVDERAYTRAQAIAAKVFLRVESHPEVQFQLARIASGEGDGERAARILIGAGEAGFEDWRRVSDDPAFGALRHSGWQIPDR